MVSLAYPTAFADESGKSHDKFLASSLLVDARADESHAKARWKRGRDNHWDVSRTTLRPSLGPQCGSRYAQGVFLINRGK